MLFILTWHVQEIAQKVAMHAVAMKPQYLDPQSVPADALEGNANPQSLTSCANLVASHALCRMFASG